MANMELLALPAFADNYIWLLHDGKDALVVDPGAAMPVQAALERRGLRLRHLLITHHHHDHIDGVAELYRVHQPKIWTAIHPQIQAVLPVGAAAQDVHELSGGEAFEALGLRWQVLAAPGHTLSHILFYTPNVAGPAGASPLLFCGDTLFSAGCGRLFEGSPAQMLQTLAVINRLPEDTQICCAHEYTLSNLRFAASVYPSNSAIAQRTLICQEQLAQGLPTLPSTLFEERSFNPFLQTLDLGAHPALPLHLPSFCADKADALSVFTALRTLRNHFS